MSTTVGQTPLKQKAWTVILYMTAADEQLERHAIRDIEELQKVGTTDDLNVVVQIHRRWAGYAERYCVRKDQSDFLGAIRGEDETPINSGSPEVLSEFVGWTRRNFEARRYLLVLWGHAYGLGFGRDHGDPLTMPELAQALEGQNIDILGANACAMSYAEAAFELRRAAKFLAAPEITMPFAGWPYAEILNEIVKKPDIEPEELGKRIVEEFTRSFDLKDVALTLLDLRRADTLDDHLRRLAHALERSIRRNNLRDEITDAFLDTSHGEVRPLIDLADLCERLTSIPDANISEAAATMQRFLKEGDDEFIVRHGADPDLEGLHGVGIFAPSVTGAADLTRLELSEKSYKKLEVTKNNEWPRLVYQDLKELLDPVNKAAAEFVLGTGATGREERMGVAQLVLSIHHSFVKLEKTLTAAQKRVIDTLEGSANGNGATGREQRVTPIRLGPPYLRLAGDLRPAKYVEDPAAAERVYGGSAVSAQAPVAQVDARLVEPIADSLSKLEDALANVERTSKKVMTHGRFGLGNPDVKSGLGNPDVKSGLGNPDVKSGLGNPDVKSGLGNPDVKSGLGNPDVKSGLGLFPWLTASGGNAVESNGAQAVTALYSQVALSLQLLEESLAKVENDVRAVLTDSMDGSRREDREYRQLAAEPVKRSFRELKEMVANARQTAGWVLGHPAYGLGPSAGGLGAPGRQQLATAGGLSPRVLRLL